jgi:hypothetical protein
MSFSHKRFTLASELKRKCGSICAQQVEARFHELLLGLDPGYARAVQLQLHLALVHRVIKDRRQEATGKRLRVKYAMPRSQSDAVLARFACRMRISRRRAV